MFEMAAHYGLIKNYYRLYASILAAELKSLEFLKFQL